MTSTPVARLHNPPDVHAPLGYSHVAEVTAATLVYVAGQVGLDASGRLAGDGDFNAQVRAAFANLERALAAARATFRDVIKLNYYCVDSVDLAVHLPTLREIRDQYVDSAAPPASTFVVVTRLVRPEWLIEIEAIAAVSRAADTVTASS